MTRREYHRRPSPSRKWIWFGTGNRLATVDSMLLPRALMFNLQNCAVHCGGLPQSIGSGSSVVVG